MVSSSLEADRQGKATVWHGHVALLAISPPVRKAARPRFAPPRGLLANDPVKNPSHVRGLDDEHDRFYHPP